MTHRDLDIRPHKLHRVVREHVAPSDQSVSPFRDLDLTPPLGPSWPCIVPPPRPLHYIMAASPPPAAGRPSMFNACSREMNEAVVIVGLEAAL